MMKSKFNIKKTTGFSLLEMTVVLIIVSILASAAIPQMVQQYMINAANKTALDISAVEEASRAFYVNNNHWPDNSVNSTPIAALQAGNYLPPLWNPINPFGISSSSPPAYRYNVTSNNNLLTVTTTVPVAVQPIIQSLLPAATVSGTTLSSSVSVPGASTTGYGPWTGGYSAGQIYKATTDGFVVANAVYPGINLYIYGYTDSVNASTLVTSNSTISSSGGDTRYASVTMPVKKGDYWQITCNTTPTIRWLPN